MQLCTSSLPHTARKKRRTARGPLAPPLLVSDGMTTGRGERSEPTQEEWAEAIVGDLAAELDEYASQREQMLEGLDLRSANVARTIAVELRSVRRTLASKPSNVRDPSTRAAVLSYRDLKFRAQDLLDGKVVGEVITSPPVSGERDADPDEITAAGTPSSMRTGKGR